MRRIRQLVHGFNLLLPPDKYGVTFLTWHLVGASTGSPVDLDREVFRAQLERLAWRTITFDHALDALQKGERLLGPRVVLTFDDAFQNFVDVIWPELDRLELPATLYVPCDFVDGRGAAPLGCAAGLPPASWDALRALTASGRLKIGSLTLSHRNLRRVPAGELEAEIADSRRRLEDQLQVSVDTFCYPQGKRSRAAEQVVRRVYTSAVVGGGRRQRPDRLDPHRLERLPLRRDTPRELERVLASPLWLEEVVASGLRQLRA